MKTSLLALAIALYCFGLQWSADQRRISALEKIASERGVRVTELEGMVAHDKLIIDTWTGLDWDRDKPIRKDCEKVNFCWTELDSCTLYQ